MDKHVSHLLLCQYKQCDTYCSPEDSLSQVMNDHPNYWPLHATKLAETPMLQCAGREAIVQELTCGL